MLTKEQEILEGINNKNLKAWEKLYHSYYASLCSYANRLLKDTDAAQDVVQETLIKVWHSKREFLTLKDLTWYLYKSIYNNALLYLRNCNIHQNVLQKLKMEEVEMPEEQFARTVQEELIRQVYMHIEKLPEERKKILLLALQGHSGNEIAKLLQISINTVKTQKTRGMKYLREKLKGSVLLFLF